MCYLHVVELTVPVSQVEVVETALEAAGIQMPVWQKAESRTAVFQGFHETVESAASALQTIRSMPGGRGFSARTIRMRNKDWQEAWKAGFKTERISKRIIIKPSWQKLAKQPLGVRP